MWTKPWTLKEGFALGAVLTALGLLLQLAIGPVDWDAFRWPFNAIGLAVFLSAVTIIFLLRKKVYAFQFIGTLHAAVPALVYAVALTIIMGLTRQTGLTAGLSPTDEGDTWLNHIRSFWPFVLIYVFVAVILGLVVARQLRAWATARFSLPAFHFSLLSHLGLFLAMTTATLGNADVQRLKMIAVQGQPEWRAMDPQNMVVEMPFSIELKQFIMETYADGSPKRFASDIQIQTTKGKSIATTVEVNKPAEVDGWKIYQYGYDTQMGIMSNTSILELVSDPWLPLVYTGIYMMFAGAVCMFVLGGGRRGGRRDGAAPYAEE